MKVANGECREAFTILQVAEEQMVEVGLMGVALALGQPDATAPTDVNLIDVGPFLLASMPQIVTLLSPDARLDVSVASESGRVICDPASFLSSLRALVLSARSAMDNGGTLRVRARKASVGRSGWASQLPNCDAIAEIVIEDLGPAIPPNFGDASHGLLSAGATAIRGSVRGLHRAKAFASSAGGVLTLQTLGGRGMAAKLRLPIIHARAR